MQSAFSLPLSCVPWNVFGTLTFKGSDAPSEAAQVREAKRFFRWVAHQERVFFWELLWALRLENGEVGGRLHLHPLIVVSKSSLGYYAVQQGRRSVVSKAWRKLGSRNGIATFRRIESENDPAVCYTVKDLDAGADIYELAKTGRTQRLLLSPAAIRMIRRRGSAGEYQSSATNTLLANSFPAAVVPA